LASRRVSEIAAGGLARQSAFVSTTCGLDVLHAKPLDPLDRQGGSPVGIHRNPQDSLFEREESSAILRQTEIEMCKYIERLDGQDLREATSLDLAERFSIPVPVLHEAQRRMVEAEVEIDVSDEPGRDTRRGPVTERGLQVIVETPYSGARGTLHWVPLGAQGGAPYGRVVAIDPLTSGTVFQEYRTTRAAAEQLQPAIRSDCEHLRRCFDLLGEELRRFNGKLPEIAEGLLAQRRAMRADDYAMLAQLGIPIVRREDAGRFEVPAARRPVGLPPPAPGGRAPASEPFLGDQIYEDILGTITNMALAIERSPETFESMDEEDIRMILLVGLNAVYAGHATGETFNAAGKTDILIRWDGQNVFIAECKCWDGPKALQNAVDQLLSYVTWRDTKTALIIFNRDRQLTTVRDGIQEHIPKHPQYVSMLPHPHPGDTVSRYRLSHPDDSARMITMTVMVFEVPKPS
jgi:hypothetical protein